MTVDDFLKARPHLLTWRRSPNAKPAFTDAEVITLGLLQGSLGTATLKRAYQIISTDFRAAFPRLPSYAQWIARLHALAPIVGCRQPDTVRSANSTGRGLSARQQAQVTPA